jgi:hypothetical protein
LEEDGALVDAEAEATGIANAIIAAKTAGRIKNLAFVITFIDRFLSFLVLIPADRSRQHDGARRR